MAGGAISAFPFDRPCAPPLETTTDQAAITRYIAETFSNVEVVVASRENGAPEIASGDSFFSYVGDAALDSKNTMPFATIVTKDYGDFDRASNLDRAGVYRLNIGVSKETYRALFGAQPPAPGPAGFVDTGHDFTELDTLMPHPVYAPQSWVCILNPSDAGFDALQPLLANAYQQAASRHANRETRIERKSQPL